MFINLDESLLSTSGFIPGPIYILRDTEELEVENVNRFREDGLKTTVRIHL